MTTDINPNREEVLFALALEKPADKRPAFLDVMCAGDTVLRARLHALLAAHDAPDELTPAAKRTIKLDLEDAMESGAAAFSPNGKHFVVPSFLGFVRVWDTATWREEATLRGFLNAVGR